MTQEEPLTGEEYREMKEKQTKLTDFFSQKTCENCGYYEKWHHGTAPPGGWWKDPETGEDSLPCKKFKSLKIK